MTTMQSTFIDKIQPLVDLTSAVRKAAWEQLLETGLPNKHSEAYKYTAITSLLEKQVEPDLRTSEDFDKRHLYNTDGSHVVIVNGVYSEEDSTIDKQVTIERKAVNEGKHDPLSLVNTLLSPEEIHISATENPSPIFVYHVNTDGFVNPRIVVHSAKSQELTLVEKSVNKADTFINSSIQFFVAENAKINFSKVQAYGDQTFAHEAIFADQKKDSRFYSNVFSFSGTMIRNNIRIDLDDENCEAYMYGLYLLDSKSHVDNNTTVDHIKPHSYSNELYKGILDEKSTGVFNGKIYVRPDAQKTNAFQSNNNILLSDDATVNTKPQLEIWADDVKCSHGCTTGQLDDDAIFYLRARGIAHKNAVAMILNAFAAETMDHVIVDEVKQEIESLIAQKLN